MAIYLEYLGGIPDFKSSDQIGMKVSSDGIKLSAGMFKKTEISFKDITNVSVKSDEQVTKDVTLGRLVTLGVLAFGAKKKTKHVTHYLIIEYNYEGMATTAMFSGGRVQEANSDIMKSRARFLKKNPAPIPAAAPGGATDAASEIAKFKDLLDSGAITQDEYDAKKRQLLGL